MSARDFYDITHDGVRLELPRVTSILRIIDKSGPLMGWAVNCERRAFQAALEDVLTQPGIAGHQDVYERVRQAVTGKRAWVRESDKAKDIGGEAHALIEWHVHRMLGVPVGDEPPISDPALRAVLAWLDWCQEVDFTPLEAERIVYCPSCMFAGTLDCIAKVEGKVLLVDWKTGKAVYPEAYLQNIAYRHAAARDGIETEGGMIVRLPKTAQDPLTEAVPVPPTPYGYFRAAKVLWMWQRHMDQLGAGPQMQRCSVEAAP
jgi:hypothetical protein